MQITRCVPKKALNTNINQSEIASDNSKKQTQIELIRAFYADRNFDSALVALHKAYSLDKGNWLIHYYYALIALERNRFESANTYAETALRYVGQQNEQRALVYAVLGLTEERLNRYGEAKAHYLTSLQLDQSCEAASEGLKRLRQLTLAE